MKETIRVAGFAVSREINEWLKWRKARTLKSKAAQFRDMAKNEMELDKGRVESCDGCSKVPWLCQCSPAH